MIDFLIDLFKSKDISKIVKNKKNMRVERTEHKFLLCLDGAEDLINSSQTEFTDFLTRLLYECKMLSIIITTSCGIKDLVAELGHAPSITLLKPLKIEQSVELFL